MTIAERVKSIRLEKKLSQKEFSGRLGISRNALVNYENGSSTPSLKVINAIAKEFDKNYQEIIGEAVLNDFEQDLLGLKIEAVKEFGAAVLSDYEKFLDSLHISWEDQANPLVILLNTLSDKLNDGLYFVETFEELEQIKGFVLGIRETLDSNKVRAA